MEKQQRMSPAQLQLMIDILNVNSELILGKITKDFTLEDRKKKWQSLADLLNSISVGGKKDAEKWRRTWRDYKCAVCAKANRIKQRLDGEPVPAEYLTATEKRVLKMIKCAQSASGSETSIDSLDNPTANGDVLTLNQNKLKQEENIKPDVNQNKVKEEENIKPDVPSVKRRRMTVKKTMDMQTSFNAIRMQIESQGKYLKEQTSILHSIAKSLQSIAKSVQHQ